MKSYNDFLHTIGDRGPGYVRFLYVDDYIFTKTYKIIESFAVEFAFSMLEARHCNRVLSQKDLNEV